MRYKNSFKASANSRFNSSLDNAGIKLSNSDIIRIGADYSKSRKVIRSLITIEETSKSTGKIETWTYIIYDADWSHKLNGTYVMVRRFAGDHRHIYLFDLTTDSYLLTVEEHLDVIGDKANETPESRKEIAEHVQKVKEMKDYGSEKLSVILKEIQDQNPIEILDQIVLTESVHLRNESDEPLETIKVLNS